VKRPYGKLALEFNQIHMKGSKEKFVKRFRNSANTDLICCQFAVLPNGRNVFKNRT